MLLNQMVQLGKDFSQCIMTLKLKKLALQKNFQLKYGPLTMLETKEFGEGIKKELNFYIKTMI